MKRYIVMSLCICAMMACVSCTNNEPVAQNEQPVTAVTENKPVAEPKDPVKKVEVSKVEEKSIAFLNGETAFQLFAQQAKLQPDDNVVLSPYSIQLAMAMVYSGASGQTAEQMKEILNYPDNESLLHSANAKTLDDLKAKSIAPTKIAIANSLWTLPKYPIEKRFTDILSDFYDTEFHQIDLMDAPKTVATVNKWVSDNTMKKIDSILNESDLDEDTRFILANALYFDARWKYSFDEKKTAKSLFHLNEKSEIRIPMMNMEEKFHYFKHNTGNFLIMPYENERFAAMFVLPPKARDLNDWLGDFTMEQFNMVLKGAAFNKVKVTIPPVHLDVRTDLIKTMEAMGLTEPFGRNANFAGITLKEKLNLTKVLHRVKVDLDEMGTVVAASTAIVGSRLLSSPPGSTPVFKVDRPYILVVFDQQDQSIILLAKCMDPRG